MGGSYYRNNTPEGKDIPTSWDISTGENVLWSARLGSQTYGNPVVANGKIFVGTNNGAGYIKRYPSRTDLGCLVCFDEATGKFLWQHSNEKLPTGRVHDWPLQGVCAAPFVDGDRLWYISNRGEICCLDTEGFHDGENDGDFKDEKPKKADLPYDETIEADVVWKIDMMAELGISQHNMCSCSVTAVGDLLFVNTSNGVDEGHINLPVPRPLFSGHESQYGKNSLDRQHSGCQCPPRTMVLSLLRSSRRAGTGHLRSRDGWIYSFDPKGAGYGEPKMLWKFDANPKESATNSEVEPLAITSLGRPSSITNWSMWPSEKTLSTGKASDTSGVSTPPNAAISARKSSTTPPTLISPSHINVCRPWKRIKRGFRQANPNAAAVWHYSIVDTNKNGKKDFEETMHRTIGSVSIKNDLLYVADFSGLVHCLDAKTGLPHWTHDMLAASWGLR